MYNVKTYKLPCLQGTMPTSSRISDDIADVFVPVISACGAMWASPPTSIDFLKANAAALHQSAHLRLYSRLRHLRAFHACPLHFLPVLKPFELLQSGGELIACGVGVL